ncbi:MAG: putative lipid II flippase FtsW [Candidatus Gastranaerophilales bacterium]|nr:putative lipid II flippase FtsW [Candidatus Gastranaerophilales bacterium]
MYYQKNKQYTTHTNTTYTRTPAENILIVAVVFIIVFGLMAVFSASAPKAIGLGDNPFSFTLKQLIWLVAGIIGAWFFSKFDYKRLKPFAGVLTLVVLGALLLVQFTPLGVTVNEAKRWLVLGPLQFQPSEMAKPALVLYFATLFSKNCNIVDSDKYPFYFMFAIMLLLIYKQPNLSMIILLIVTALAMYYVAGGSTKIITSGIIGGILIVATTIRDYQLQRIKVWWNPFMDALGSGYNIIQSMVAFSTGGFFGVGFGNSKQKLSWLPEGHTDFIFAIIGEEFGFLGCFFLICLFGVFLHRGFIIAKKCPDMFGKILAIGITFSICFQAFTNMSVASSFVPATGIPLPFISYGGSSLFVSLCMIGVLINISKKRVQRIVHYVQ